MTGRRHFFHISLSIRKWVSLSASSCRLVRTCMSPRSDSIGCDDSFRGFLLKRHGRAFLKLFFSFLDIVREHENCQSLSGWQVQFDDACSLELRCAVVAVVFSTSTRSFRWSVFTFPKLCCHYCTPLLLTLNHFASSFSLLAFRTLIDYPQWSIDSDFNKETWRA